MRVAQVAAVAGVSVRTIRHYHRVGVLPEPPRSANGYREYGIRDAALLVRARRLVALGLRLEQVADVLAGERDHDLRGVLVGIDADLAAQEAELRDMRRRIATLLEAGGSALPDDVGPVTEVIARIAGTDGAGSELAGLDADLLAVLPFASGAPATGAETVDEAELRSIYADLASLREAEPDDPRVGALADRACDFFLAHVGAPDSGTAPFGPRPGDVEGVDGAALLASAFDGLAPAQRAVIERIADRIGA